MTVFGQSAGGGSVAALLAMPRAAGLFRRAVAQSVPGTFFSPELAADIAAACAAELGVRPTAADLSAVDPSRLPAAGDAVSAKIDRWKDRWGPITHRPIPFAPVVDGDVLPAVGDRRWLLAFGAETAGWLMYVAALRLAPLSLVQAIAASGVAVLAFATARGHPSRLARREQVAVVLAIAGLMLLAFSLVDTTESDQRPAVAGVVIWLAACGGGAVLLIAIPTRFARAASLGLAAGLLFADGDISAKLGDHAGRSASPSCAVPGLPVPRGRRRRAGARR